MRTPLFALTVLALAAPALAGPGGGGSTTATAPAKTHGSSPPGESKLPRSSAVGTSVATAPFAWVDDASLLSPGGAAFSVAVVSWQGTDASETDVPVVGVAAGVLPRFQLSARVPYVVSNDTTGVTGGVGTSYISGKIALLHSDGDGLKLAVAPTLQLLGTNITLASTDSRARWGLPVSAEFDSGATRVFASAGYFSGGVGFAGGGLSVDLGSHVSVSGSLSHSWVSDSTIGSVLTAGSDRTDIAGGASFSLTSHAALFGSVSQTIGTSDANGAGVTIVAGILLVGETTHR